MPGFTLFSPTKVEAKKLFHIEQKSNFGAHLVKPAIIENETKMLLEGLVFEIRRDC